MDSKAPSVTEALEALAVALAESGALPAAELARAFERTADRLRNGSAAHLEVPDDLVTQAEASRRIGVSRQAVNQWVRKGLVQAYPSSDRTGRTTQHVSLSEIAVAANRGAPPSFRPERKREMSEFFALLRDTDVAQLTDQISMFLDNGPSTEPFDHETRLLREFVIAAMDNGIRQREFTAQGVELLAELEPKLPIDPKSDFGRLTSSLGTLVTSANGTSGFDSGITAMLTLLAAATVGVQYGGSDTLPGRQIAHAAQEVWGEEWIDRLYDGVSYMGEVSRAPLTRYTASLSYLDENRFLRSAQVTGASISYARGPGPVLPQRYYGAHIYDDILSGRRVNSPVWAFSADAAEKFGRPDEVVSSLNPFRVFLYEYGLVDTRIHGIRRYCYSFEDARDEFQRTVISLEPTKRSIYIEAATQILSRVMQVPGIELVAVTSRGDFDWWKDHIIRSSPSEIFIGLRDERARKVAHALRIRTEMLPELVNADDNSASLRDRLRIYVKNLEFDIVEARYRDDLRRGMSRLVKEGGTSLSDAEALERAREEITRLMDSA